MNLEFNPLAHDSKTNDSSISRYLGGAFPGANSGIGLADKSFLDILDTQMMDMQPISSQVETILQRLENDQPLVGMTDQQAAEAIFDSIKQILSGVLDVLKSLGKTGASGESLMDELSRLIEGAKHLFDRSEDPYVLEQMAEAWETLRKKKSPVFHSVHAYFFHIGVTYSDDQTDGLETDIADVPDDSDGSVYAYSEQTSMILLEVVESLTDCSEKDELLNLLDMVNIRDSDDDLDSDDMIHFDDVASSEQTTFFFE